MDWKGIFWMARRALSDNKPAVLFGGGVMCLGACVAFTAKASFQVKDSLRDLRSYVLEDGEKKGPVVPEEERAAFIAREVVVPYIPAAVAGIAAISSFALSNRRLSKQAAGAVAACTIAEKALNAYQDGVIKELGEEVHDQIVQAMTDEVPDEIREMSEGYISSADIANRFPHEINDKMYYDHVTGRLFYSSDEKIKDAESTVNKLLIDTGIATVNDFYSALLLDCDSVIGDAIGWRVDDSHARNMDVIFGSRLDRENNLPMITIGYRTCAVNLRELERR